MSLQYNRSYFEKQMLRLQHEKYSPVGVIICDVDGLKLINDTFGHTSVDALLKTAADIISADLNGNAVAARIGGDEFALLLTNT